MINNRALTRAYLVGLGLTSVTTVFAHDDLEELDLTIVSANRLSSSIDSTTSSVGVISDDEIERSQNYLLRDILDTEGGVFGFSSAGQLGQTGSVAIQGLPTRFTQVSVDGFPLSGASFALGNFLGNTSSIGYKSVEILKGGQPTSYGNAAVGGVIYLNNDYGDGVFGLKVSGEVGSFGSWFTDFATKGSVGNLRYNIGGELSFNENDRNEIVPIQDFRNESFFANFAYELNDSAEAKFSVRTQNSELTLDPNAFSSFGTSLVDTDTVLLTGSLDLQLNPFVDAKVYVGRSEEDNDIFSDFGDFVSRNRIISGGLDTSSEISDQGVLHIGGQYSSIDRETGAADGNFDESSIYASYQHTLPNSVLLEGGLRYQDSSDFSGDLGFNLGVRADLNDAISVRARYANGYRTPTPLEAGEFGGSFPQTANPDLDPEEIQTWEAGVTVDLADNHSLELTGYYHRLDNAISSVFSLATFTSQNVNLTGVSEVAGFTAILEGSFLGEALHYKATWDYLLRNDVVEFPRNQANIDVYYSGSNWTIGLGSSTRSSGNFAGETDANIIFRAYGSYDVNDVLRLNARVENIFDEEFVVTGFGDIPGAGTTVFFGATLEF